MDNLMPGINTGVIPRPPRASAWVNGGESGAFKPVLEINGQWDAYLPDEEAQSVFNPYLFDTSACVTFSGTNDLETLLNRLRALGILPVTHETFLQQGNYVNKQSGKVNFSDRFSAKMSGTTQAGNYLEAVGDSLRRDGVVAESDWPFPPVPTTGLKWEEYYAEIPNDLKNKGKKFLDYFDISYEWTLVGTPDATKLRNALQYGPVQIAASVCSPWSSNEAMPPIPACGCGTGHATLIYGYNSDNAWKDFDHYKSFKKLLASDYCIQWGFQYFLGIKNLNPTPAFHYVFNENLTFGYPASQEVMNLQKALQTLKRPDGTTYMKAGTFGPYGPATKLAVGLFQIDNGIPTSNPGNDFGPKTRARMNSLLNG